MPLATGKQSQDTLRTLRTRGRLHCFCRVRLSDADKMVDVL
jgi:hypothetical protein